MAIPSGHQKFVDRGVDPVTGSVSGQSYLNELFAQYGIDPVTGMILPGGGTGSRRINIPQFPDEEPERDGNEHVGSDEDPSGGPLGDTMVRTPDNNFGWVDKGLAMGMVGAFGGAVGKLANMVVNGNNVHAVNAARAHMGLAPLSTSQALGSLAKGPTGKVADLEINGKQVSVSLASPDSGKKSVAEVVQGAVSSVFGSKKDEKEEIQTMTVEEALAASKAAGLDQVVEVTPEGKKESGKRSLAEVITAPVQNLIDQALGRTPQAPTAPVTPATPVTPVAPTAPAQPVQTGFLAPVSPVTSQPLSAPTATPAPTGAPLSPVTPGVLDPVQTPAGTYNPQSGFITPSVPVTALDYPAAVPVEPEVLSPVGIEPPSAPSAPSTFTPSVQQAPVDDPFGIGSTPSVSFNNPGQDRVQQAVSDSLLGLSAEIGQPVTVNSGYRSPSYNARTPGAARNSLHTQGRAADISLKGMDAQQRQDVVQELTQRGASGFITYSRSPDMMHVDWGARPAGARGTIDRSVTPLEAPHFMHDYSVQNLANAPDWFQDIAAVGGIKNPDVAPVPEPSPLSGTYATPGTVDAPQGAFAQGFMSATPGVDPEKAFSAPGMELAPNQQLGPKTSEIYGWERTPDVRDQMAQTIAGELGSRTIQGVLSGNPEAVQTARQEIAAIASTMDNRAFSRQYANPADPREAYRDVLSGSQYNANLSRNQATTQQNYSLVGDFINQALVDYDMGMNPSPVPEATHYRSLDIASPSWENTKATPVGEHTFSTSNLAGMDVAEYQPSINADAFTSFMEPSKASTPSTIDAPDGLLSPDMDKAAQSGFDQNFDIEAAKSAMSMEAPSPSPTAQAGTLGSTTSFLDEPTGMLSPENALSSSTSKEKEEASKEQGKEENTTEAASSGSEDNPASSSTSNTSSSGGGSGGFTDSDREQTSQSAGLW